MQEAKGVKQTAAAEKVSETVDTKKESETETEEKTEPAEKVVQQAAEIGKEETEKPKEAKAKV